MPILTDQLAIYAPPKTGSSWVVRALEASGLRVSLPPYPAGHSARHAPLDRPAAAALAGDRMTVAMLRHPLPWLASFHAHVCRRRQHVTRDNVLFDGPFAELMAAFDPEWERFLTNLICDCPGAVWRLMRSYAGGPGLTADRLICSERLAPGLAGCLVDAGARCDWEALINTPPANRTPEPDRQRRGYAPEVVLAIEDTEAPLLDLLATLTTASRGEEVRNAS